MDLNKILSEISKKHSAMKIIFYKNENGYLYIMLKDPSMYSADSILIVRYKNGIFEEKYAIESIMDWKINLNEGWTAL